MAMNHYSIVIVQEHRSNILCSYFTEKSMSRQDMSVNVS